MLPTMKMLRPLRNLIAVAALTVTVSACGGKDVDVVEVAANRPLDILIDWQAEPTYLGIYYAVDKGYLAELGFSATVTQSWGATQAVAAVASGKHLIGTASGGATVLGRNDGANVRSLSVLYPKIPTVVYGLSQSGISSPADLKGKRIGIYPGSVTVNEFDAFLSLNNIRKDEITVVSLSGADIPYLLSGQVDAVLHYTEMSPVTVETSEDVPGIPGERVFELKLAEYGVTGYGLNIIGNSEAAAKQSIDLGKVSDALVKGYAEGCSAKEEAVSLFLKRFPDKSPTYVAQSWNKVCQLVGDNPGFQNTDGWQSTIDLYQTLGILSVPVTPQDVMAN